MLQSFVHLSILYLVCVSIVGGLSVTRKNNNATRHIDSSEATLESFFTNTASITNFTINDTRTIQHRYSNSSKFDNPKKFGQQSSGDKTKIIVKIASIVQKNTTQESGAKNPINLFAGTLKIPAINKKNRVIHRKKMQKLKPSGVSIIRDKTSRTDVEKNRKKFIDVAKEQRAEDKRRKKLHILQDPRAEKEFIVEGGQRAEYPALDVKKAFLNESSLSLRSLPIFQKPTDCSSRKGEVAGMQRNADSGQSSAAIKGHTELMNQSEKEQSQDELAAEYVHPEGHFLSPATDYGKMVNSVFGFDKPESKYESMKSRSKYSFNGDSPANPFSNENGRLRVMEVSDTLDSISDNGDKADKADMEMRYNDDSVKPDYYLSLKHKRDVETILDDLMRSFGGNENEGINKKHVAMEEKLLSKEVSVETAENSSNETTQTSEKPIQNFTSQISLRSHNSDNVHTTDTPWPLVPGPISCDVDFQLQPSFVANLGEFDYVVSVQLKLNPDEPADHACTGVVYNPRFIVIAPHCLHDNYGLTVTPTDDLCTVDEMIGVDYIIEHENYDDETRENDIALIKLRSEIHKKAAKFPKEDGALGKSFYAVGFGELMWRSFPNKISKLLQKVPVQRYSRVPKETPGTMHITTSHMDLTGAYRGDFGGALINPRGEFVGLKSRSVKKSTEYEVYTRVQTYLPWIQAKAAFHGLW